MQEHQFQIEKVAYMTDYDKATMIVTMSEDKHVTITFIGKAAVRKSALKVNHSWPSFSFKRRKAIFNMIIEARTKYPDTVYKARPGAQTLKFMRNKKGIFQHHSPQNVLGNDGGHHPG